MAQIEWRAPQLSMKTLENYERTSGNCVGRNGRVIDVGTGTGLSGIAIRQVGFTGDIDALEPSKSMFEKAKEKNIYSRYYSDFLIENKETTVTGDAYDLVVSVGVFSNRSVRSQCLCEVIRMAKPGALVVILMVKNWYKSADFSDALKKIEKDKVANLAHLEEFEGIFEGHDAVGFVLEKL
ncbi:uncharacterized protein LOC134841119 [Symsagittifera roscoffensis]|uniref:uncharacterized protein LOC134841119 n=1 Tax=Symsagittifera roscoffensis TaxID=84072 RepID=UPI00307C49C8